MSLNTQLDGIIGQLFSNTLVAGLTLSESATYRKITVGALDYATQTYPETVVDTTVNIIKSDFDANEVAQSSGHILTTDVKFYVRPQTGVTLLAMKDDKIIYSGDTYNVESVEKKALGPTDMVFIIQGRAING